MTTIPLPPIERLRQLFCYSPETGDLTRRIDGPGKGNVAGARAGSAQPGCYSRVNVDGRKYLTHRLIWKMATGDEPEFIDHINGDRQDNRIGNLRSVSRKENQQNLKLPKNNTSGTPGVYWHQTRRWGRWAAKIHCDGKKINLGYHLHKRDAVRARKEAEIRLGFHENHGRE